MVTGIIPLKYISSLVEFYYDESGHVMQSTLIIHLAISPQMWQSKISCLDFPLLRFFSSIEFSKKWAFGGEIGRRGFLKGGLFDTWLFFILRFLASEYDDGDGSGGGVGECIGALGELRDLPVLCLLWRTGSRFSGSSWWRFITGIVLKSSSREGSSTLISVRTKGGTLGVLSVVRRGGGVDMFLL